MTTTIDSPASLPAHAGTTMGTTEWMEITQDRVNMFADATGDHQWIHVDPERAAAGPFGGTIAHGFLTLSLAPLLIAETVEVGNVSAALNYGLNKVRFPAMVPVGKRIRGSVELVSAQEKPVGMETVFRVTYEVEGSDRPACVAECVVLYR
ncbi:MaoC family dehydratase [Gordonia rhizosphera]|uniref:Putative enoyl-CoA hydratase n=1 Tax=Gordonia rhizosphera NBRC 16068 TaxID=1108045 RepID=K6W808_9ACTN|nr:MaoC family dehydratase [Gordonia rhizosphera]GAB88347.1 putative enoyl-CoA hydratase [Gordonia rhizosphera NBRC 16068]